MLKVLLGTSVLPNDRIRNGGTCFAIPKYRRLTLISNPDRRKILGTKRALGHGLFNHLQGAAPDFLRVMLDPSRLGIDLLMFALSHGDDSAGTVEDDETGAGSPLVDGTDVSRHSGTEYNQDAGRMNDVE